MQREYLMYLTPTVIKYKCALDCVIWRMAVLQMPRHDSLFGIYTLSVSDTLFSQKEIRKEEEVVRAPFDLDNNA